MKMKTNVKYLVQGAVIAAMYIALTLLLKPISYGQLQVRVAEALTILPFFTPAAVPGLFIGCLLANVFGGLGLLDIIFGSIATLIAAYLTSKIKIKWLAPLPSVIVNAIIVGWVISEVYALPYLITALFILVGQFIACYGIGYPLLLLLKQTKIFDKENN